MSSEYVKGMYYKVTIMIKNIGKVTDMIKKVQKCIQYKMI
jgi:hypothetical protein